jgi:pimeloyl-ACP methyl ester carboxylesterase
MTTSSRTGTARAHDGSAFPFVVAGTGSRWLLLGFAASVPSTSDPTGQVAWLEALGKDYRLIFPDFATYAGDPKMYTLTPGAVARDYLAIADAAGAERFAYYGYSFGAVTGLQLALRTDRVAALISGGFPMLGGPYAAMLKICRTMEAGPIWGMPWAPESARQFITYYEGLRSFDDRATQNRLLMPRLNFAGRADDIEVNGEMVARVGQTVADHQAELEGFGWDVRLLDGLDHPKALMPDVAVPLVSEWLRKHTPAR